MTAGPYCTRTITSRQEKIRAVARSALFHLPYLVQRTSRCRAGRQDDSTRWLQAYLGSEQQCRQIKKIIQLLML